MRSVLLLIPILAIANCVDLPSYFTKCKSHTDLNGCLLKNTKTGWHTMIKGDNKYHIQPMNPLRVPFIQINIDGNLQGNLSNAAIDGMEHTDFQEIKLDLTKKRLDVTFLIPRLNFLGDYGINGKLLLLPITGNGPANLTFVNMLNKYFLEYDIEEKDSKQYIHVKDSAMKYTVTRAHFRLDNLFNGNEALANAMNKVLEESWEAVNEEIGASVGDAIGLIFTEILQSFFHKVSLNELFDD